MGKISREDFQKLSFASQRLAELPLYIDDTPALTIAALRTRARRLKRRHDIGLIVVDYLQLLQGSGRAGRQPRQRNLGNQPWPQDAGQGTAAVPVIALSQLSRAVEQREDKRPHAVRPARIGLDRAGRRHGLVRVPRGLLRRRQANPSSPPKATIAKTRGPRCMGQEMERVYGLAELIVAKQRHGSTGKVRMKFEASLRGEED
jgi:replicative DNA helicase